MPYDAEIKQAMLHYLSGTNVMNHLVSDRCGRSAVYHDPDVGNTSTQVPANNVAWQVVTRLCRNYLHHPMPLKKFRQVGYPAVNDVSVGPA